MTTETAKTQPLRPTLRNLARILGDHHQPFQSDYQNDHFVLRQEGITLWGSYKQAMREVGTRIEAMRIEYIELNEVRAEVAGKKDVADKKGKNRTSQAKAIQAANAQYSASKAILKEASLALRMKDREREMAHLVNRLFAIHAALTDLYGHDWPIEDMEADFWAIKIKRRALAEKACHGQVTAGTLECILALDENDMADTLAFISTKSAKECVEELTSMQLPDITALNVPRLVEPDDVRPLLSGSDFLANDEADKEAGETEIDDIDGNDGDGAALMDSVHAELGG